MINEWHVHHLQEFTRTFHTLIAWTDFVNHSQNAHYVRLKHFETQKFCSERKPLLIVFTMPLHVLLPLHEFPLHSEAVF